MFCLHGEPSVFAVGADSGDTAPSLSIQEVSPTSGATGDKIRILGFGFGGIPENLSVGVRLADGRVVPMPILGATDTEIEAVLGPVPDAAQTGQVVVRIGSGICRSVQSRSTMPPRWVSRPVMVESRGSAIGDAGRGGADSHPVDPRWDGLAGVRPLLPLAYEDVSLRGPLCVWNGSGLGEAQAPGEFVARPGPASSEWRWMLGRLSEGALSLRIDGDLPTPTILEIQVRIEDEGGDVVREVRVSNLVLGGEGAVGEKAERIADGIRSAFAQWGATEVDCRVSDVTPDAATLRLELPGKTVARGTLNLLVERQPVTLSAPRVLRGAGTRFERVTFQVATVAGRKYRIQSQDGPGSDGWRDVMEIAGTGGPMEVEDSAAGSPIRFYRVVEE